jgi:hypothetical protein
MRSAGGHSHAGPGGQEPRCGATKKVTGTGRPDPIGVVVLHMSKTRPGRAPPLLRGRRCAPSRHLRPGWHLPLSSGQSLQPRWNIPPAGVTFTKPHQGFTCVRPSPRPAWMAARGREQPIRRSRRSSPCLWPPGGTGALGLLPRASHPAVTRDARRGGDEPCALARVLHLRHQPNSIGASHFTQAPSHRT